jgi:malonyl-CoA O-methyltransferase
MSLSLDDALPEKRAVRRAFDRARSFDSACFIHDETRARLDARLDVVRLAPAVAVDLGCATGRGAALLAARYPAATVLAIDSSLPMLEAAAAHLPAGRGVLGDAEALPLRAASVDLLLANLVLPWCRPERLFAEAARVLTDGGALMFATVGPDSLQEVRAAFGAVDDFIHVHAAFDVHDLGDFAVAAGLADPVLDVDRIEVTYADLGGLVRDLRAVGGVNLAGGRRRTLTGRRRFGRFAERLPRNAEGRLAVTVELVMGHAFGRGIPRGASVVGGEVRVPLTSVGRRSEST